MDIKYTKWQYNIPNGSTIFQMALQYSKWQFNIPYGSTIYQMALTYADIFHFKALRNIPKFGFLVRK
jgi:hypothetical protein